MTYGTWTIWNATEDSTCPPDAVGQGGQIQRADQTRVEAEAEDNGILESANWGAASEDWRIIRYRIWHEPMTDAERVRILREALERGLRCDGMDRRAITEALEATK